MSRLLLLAIAAALMALAALVYALHRPPEASAPLYREDDDGVTWA